MGRAILAQARNDTPLATQPWQFHVVDSKDINAFNIPGGHVYFNSGLAYLLNRAAGEAHCVAAPSALIGASNFFELAVAAAISLFGFSSGAALATVVGVLIEVPVMLSVVKLVNASRGWYEQGRRVKLNGMVTES